MDLSYNIFFISFIFIMQNYMIMRADVDVLIFYSFLVEVFSVVISNKLIVLVYNTEFQGLKCVLFLFFVFCLIFM